MNGHLDSVPAAGLLGLVLRPCWGWADEPATAAELAAKAVNFLRPRQADGSWSGDRKEPGITALVVTAMLRSGRVTPDDPAVIKGLAYLERFLGPKGGLSEAPHSVYSTSVALMAFHEANKGGRYDRVIKGGQDSSRRPNGTKARARARTTPSTAASGYGGGNSRPDLSNTAFFIEALRDTGLPADDPALQKALVFVSRCQNLKSEFNDQPGAGKVNDGGFVYTPTTGDEPGTGSTAKAKARPVREGRGTAASLLRRHDLRRAQEHDLRRAHQDDPRVKAALDSSAKTTRSKKTPAGSTGSLLLLPDVRQGDGAARQANDRRQHRAKSTTGEPSWWRPWRNARIPAVSWANRDDRFMEGDPNIVTSYGLLALVSRETKA